MPLLLVLVRVILLVVPVKALEWTRQNLSSPFEGETTGVKFHDLNGDGALDILFSAGRHDIDQSYILMNLGRRADGSVRFSEALPFGDLGGYYQVDVAPLSSLAPGHWAVLLAGGVCAASAVCRNGITTPGVLLDLSVSGCSVSSPDTPCSVGWSTIWEEDPATGNRNGALSTELTDDGDPAIVLVGNGCLAIWHPVNGVYPVPPDFALMASEKVPEVPNIINRSAGLAVGRIGKRVGVVIGTRSSGQFGPAPVVAVYREADGSYQHWSVDGSEAYLYRGNPYYSPQATSLALADLNGDGNVDIIPALFLSSSRVRFRFPIAQTVMLVDEDPRDNVPLQETEIFSTLLTGRVVKAVNIFSDSDLPDLVYGMENGVVVLFRNLGVRDGEFLGFQLEDVIEERMDDCFLRDLAVALVDPCVVSIVLAYSCDDVALDSNRLFMAETTCSDPSEPPSVSPTTSDSPSMLPSERPSSSPTRSVAPSPLPSNAPSFDPTVTASSVPTRASCGEKKDACLKDSDCCDELVCNHKAVCDRKKKRRHFSPP